MTVIGLLLAALGTLVLLTALRRRSPRHLRRAGERRLYDAGRRVVPTWIGWAAVGSGGIVLLCARPSRRPDAVPLRKPRAARTEPQRPAPGGPWVAAGLLMALWLIGLCSGQSDGQALGVFVHLPLGLALLVVLWWLGRRHSRAASDSSVRTG